VYVTAVKRITMGTSAICRVQQISL